MVPKLIWFQTKAIAIIVSGRWTIKGAVFVVVHTVLQVIINVTLACLPIKTIWKLEMSTKHKIQITLILLLGFLTVIATIFGGMYRLDALTGMESPLNWARVELAASIEMFVGVTCVSFPAWKQVWKRWFKTGECAQNLRSTGTELGERPKGECGSEEEMLHRSSVQVGVGGPRSNISKH